MAQRGFCRRLVDLGHALLVELVVPGRAIDVVLARLVVAGEQPVLEAEALLDDVGGVGVGLDVLLVDLAVAQQVTHHARQEGDVGARPDRRVDVGHRGRAGEARIDHDQLGAVVGLGLGHPLEAAGVGFGGIAAHDENEISVLDVVPAVRHRAASECGAKTGHRRTVSNSCLVFERQYPGRIGRTCR